MIYETFSISLPDGAPFRLDLTVLALRRRKTNIVDQWEDNQYTRIIVFNNKPIKLTVTQEETSAGHKLNITLQSKEEILRK